MDKAAATSRPRAIARMLAWLAALLAAAPLTAAPPAPPPIRVFAASSLTEAATEAGRVFTRRTGRPVAFSFASSGTIARQLEAGAPAELFLSADAESMDYAAAKGAIRTASRRALAGNTLVLVAPIGPAMRVVTIDRRYPLSTALGASGRLAVGDPAYVPAGRYAREALVSQGLWPIAEPRLAKAENVRAALALVSRGEAPLGIVYATDAALDRGVRVVGRFAERSHAPIVYPIALTVRAGRPAAGFYHFLLSADGRAILARYGFTRVP